MTPPSFCCLPRAPCSHDLLLLAADHFPPLELGERATLLDPDDVVHVIFVSFVVGVVFLRAAHGLLHDRMGEAALHAHHHRLVLLAAPADALRPGLRPPSLPPPWLSRAGRASSAGPSPRARARAPAGRHASAPRWS